MLELYWQMIKAEAAFLKGFWWVYVIVIGLLIAVYLVGKKK